MEDDIETTNINTKDGDVSFMMEEYDYYDEYDEYGPRRMNRYRDLQPYNIRW